VTIQVPMTYLGSRTRMNVILFLLTSKGRVFRKYWGKSVREKEITFIEHLLFEMLNKHDQFNSHWRQILDTTIL
jgi:hypothetical protein